MFIFCFSITIMLSHCIDGYIKIFIDGSNKNGNM